VKVWKVISWWCDQLNLLKRIENKFKGDQSLPFAVCRKVMLKLSIYSILPVLTKHINDIAATTIELARSN